MMPTTVGCKFARMEKTGKRIAMAREQMGLNQSELARKLGVSPQSVQAWESGKNTPRNSKLLSIGQVLGVSINYLMGITDESHVLDDEGNWPLDLEARLRGGFGASTDALQPDEIVIPRFDVAASMGKGVELSESYVSVIQRMTVSIEWLKQQSLSYSSADNLAIITGDGDSMAGTFDHGDALLVDRGVTELKTDAVYVFAIDGEMFIKRLQRMPGGEVRVISDNKLYEPYTLTTVMKARFTLLARVLLVWNAKKL